MDLKRLKGRDGILSEDVDEIAGEVNKTMGEVSRTLDAVSRQISKGVEAAETIGESIRGTLQGVLSAARWGCGTREPREGARRPG